MKTLHDGMKDLHAATTAPEDSVGRVHRRLQAHRRGPLPVGRLMRHLPAPEEGALLRIRIRLAAYRRQQWRWAPALVPMLAAAAVALLVMGRLTDRMADDEPLPPAALDSPASWAEVTAGDHVALSYQGRGRVSGHEKDIHIDWTTGRIEVDVTPEQGIALEVATREASVKVVGTAFSVSRDTLGSHVAVRHGKVQVDCREGEHLVLGAGETTTCTPVTATGLLARAQTLFQQGHNAESLAAADLGLSYTEPDGAVVGELSVVRLNNLVALGRGADAIQEAERYLASPNPSRGGEVQDLLLSLALVEQDCERALPLLEQFPEGALDTTQTAWLHACRSRQASNGASTP